MFQGLQHGDDLVHQWNLRFREEVGDALKDMNKTTTVTIIKIRRDYFSVPLFRRNLRRKQEVILGQNLK
jgi:hypothetical protein